MKARSARVAPDLHRRNRSRRWRRRRAIGERRERPRERRGGAQRTRARAGAGAPNPKTPPFYLDLPTKNGEVVPDVAVKWAANSPVAMLAQYVHNRENKQGI